MNEESTFSEYEEIMNKIRGLERENDNHIAWCKEHGENAFVYLKKSLGISDMLLNTLGNWLDHPRHTKSMMRFFPYPGMFAGFATSDTIAVLLGLCESFGLSVTIHPPTGSEYGQGTWKVEMKAAELAKEIDTRLHK